MDITECGEGINLAFDKREAQAAVFRLEFIVEIAEGGSVVVSSQYHHHRMG